jgi:osmotically-inducible protein OsmY
MTPITPMIISMKKSLPAPQRWWLTTLAGVCLATSMTACVPLVVGGAMMGGAMVATDRRTSATQLEDEAIVLRSNSRLRSSLSDGGHVNVTSYNRQVLLTGEVSSEQEKKMAEETVSRVDNVQKIISELDIMEVSSLRQRSSDVLVTGRVRASLVDAKDVFANAFKVVTERGTTYLIGRVTQREADRATEIARSTPGVQKVVRIFEIISEEELQRMLPQPPQPGKTPSPSPAFNG